jgi:arylsulfatase
MVDRMDREIGRVLGQVRAMGAWDDTLVFFLSDNGASAEIMVRGDGHDPHAECGTGATFLSIGPGWSSLANTPFRRHKTWVHEGGISTPLIVHWPAGIAARGELRHAPGHVIDLVPTVLEVAGGRRPEPREGKPVPPAPGKSLVPLFAKDGADLHDMLWWLHEGNRALRAGNWKVVAAGKDSPWELYDLTSDRSESRDLAQDRPEKVRELASAWVKQFEDYCALAAKDLPPDVKADPKK